MAPLPWSSFCSPRPTPEERISSDCHFPFCLCPASHLFLSISYRGYLYTLSRSRAFAHGWVLCLADLYSLRRHSCLFAFPDSPVWIRYLSFVCPIFIRITARITIDYKHLLSIPNEMGPTSPHQGICLILTWIFNISHNTCYQWEAY